MRCMSFTCALSSQRGINPPTNLIGFSTESNDEPNADARSPVRANANHRVPSTGTRLHKSLKAMLSKKAVAAATLPPLEQHEPDQL